MKNLIIAFCVFKRIYLYLKNVAEVVQRRDRKTSQLQVTDGVSFDKWKCEPVIDFSLVFHIALVSLLTKLSVTQPMVFTFLSKPGFTGTFTANWFRR